jgi:hypothetical protein
MSTALNDLASGGLVAAGLYPDTQTASVNGPAVDMVAADGECFAVQQVGAFSDDTTLSGHIEESANGTTSWAAISGATFDDVSAADSVQVIRFTRTARYVRYVGTLTGDTPSVVLAVLIGEQKKTI